MREQKRHNLDLSLHRGRVQRRSGAETSRRAGIDVDAAADEEVDHVGPSAQAGEDEGLFGRDPAVRRQRKGSRRPVVVPIAVEPGTNPIGPARSRREDHVFAARAGCEQRFHAVEVGEAQRSRQRRSVSLDTIDGGAMGAENRDQAAGDAGRVRVIRGDDQN